MLDVKTTKKLLKLQSKVLIDYTRGIKAARKTGPRTKENMYDANPAAIIRQECRYLARYIHVAKCLLRGRTIEQIEGSSEEPLSIDHPIIVALMAGEVPVFSTRYPWNRIQKIYDGNLLAFHATAVAETAKLEVVAE